MVVVGVQVAVDHLGVISDPNRKSSGGRNASFHPFLVGVVDVLQKLVLVGTEEGGGRVGLQGMVPQRGGVSKM